MADLGKAAARTSALLSGNGEQTEAEAEAEVADADRTQALVTRSDRRARPTRPRRTSRHGCHATR